MSAEKRRSSKVAYAAESVTQHNGANAAAAAHQKRFGWLYERTGAKVPARLVLYFLSWSGFLVSFMMRNDINFALVAMTQPSVQHITAALTNVSSNHFNGSDHTTMSPSQPNRTVLLLDGNEMHGASLADDDAAGDQFAWTSTTKSFIVSSFYWCYVLSQVVGGIATQHFGTKHVFGWSQFATALCSLGMPHAADWHYGAVIFLRSVQGFASGLTWPAMYALVGVWIPLAERSRFMSSFQGFSIGIGLTYPLCGFLIAHFGWRSIFYTTGTLGMLWCLMWYLLAYNTPRTHPRIASAELHYIELHAPCSQLRCTAADGDAYSNGTHFGTQRAGTQPTPKVPWRHIFLSAPAWAISITTFGRIWIHYIFIVCGPTFMKNILGFEYKTNGFLSGLPFICSYVSAVFFCYAADKMVLLKWLNLTQVRKLFTAASQIVPGLLIYSIGYIEHNIALLLVVWFVAVTFITAAYAGAMANIVDIAPNFAGPVLAFCQTIHMSASFISPLVSGLIVTDERSIEQWRIVFGISSAVTILTYAVFQIYGTAEIQKWNNVIVVPHNGSPENGAADEEAEEEARQMIPMRTHKHTELIRASSEPVH